MLGSLILVGICIYLFFLLIRIQRPKNFPPGPRPLPIFGNLLHLNIRNPLKDFEMAAQKQESERERQAECSGHADDQETHRDVGAEDVIACLNGSPSVHTMVMPLHVNIVNGHSHQQ
ncbi:hypothetical protein AMELA_G00011530 [Ameiurus melas]|uniref:Uncharacterized protein n=1 Tax=Ameiurus melas TaxID=219545 RepID=A0A7J6BI68_AMEME|nr:hypothetical protein AMELA_G00011530 [Ameiurus melas]